MHIAHQRRAALGEGGFAFGVAGKEAVELRAVGDAVDAHVDERRAGLDHLRRDEARAADGGHQNVGLAGDRAPGRGSWSGRW